ncbi:MULTISPECIES: NRDE family protein [unclassified Pseudomonas]|uniref:NRDE family protein n=1 Tax=unclassified Pseudomonas TaxID=196821 RepID=UPI000BCD8758|nr:MULTISPECIES: NRDE family protein [unclassified Pseudomonas]PVZ15455.1 uncharacterized protein with NRDE domain [Pseudomonas sp. URIL14HWK12:I12]PVZ24829.1 uncharacterized protein with NRDE domain [Pseudomonas sp. URIL14HWK12:I10]PVZ34675.1 uncharacterized protein with NRDE domain [Pseudomonas sp. URIL14HWK12:I11]SNZ08930.1 Uncharacterized conserved protein, contains NRDE domain [Pseudomonas sp. URIL14HWK12:I9]
MCLIVFAWRPGHALPLLVAANRDEFHRRPSAQAAQWDDAPTVYAGRDLEAGGTWLGLSTDGRFAAVTNVRDPAQPLGQRSRGELPRDWLAGTDTLDRYAARVLTRAGQYSGFNLLLSDGRRLCWISQDRLSWLNEGVYGLSNAQLDTPWPKLIRAQQALEAELENPEPEALFRLLSDTTQPADEELPDTGVGLDTERRLASAFIQGEHYGTRASTLVYAWENGEHRLLERSFGPHGQPQGEADLRFTVSWAPVD